MYSGFNRWSLNSCGKCSCEWPIRGAVCGTMCSIRGADAGCLATDYESLFRVGIRLTWGVVQEDALNTGQEDVWNRTSRLSCPKRRRNKWIWTSRLSIKKSLSPVAWCRRMPRIRFRRTSLTRRVLRTTRSHGASMNQGLTNGN